MSGMSGGSKDVQEAFVFNPVSLTALTLWFQESYKREIICGSGSTIKLNMVWHTLQGDVKKKKTQKNSSAVRKFPTQANVSEREHTSHHN